MLRSGVSGNDMCRCSCHRGSGKKCMAPCCFKCPHCHMNIRRYAYERHEKKCGAQKHKE